MSTVDTARDTIGGAASASPWQSSVRDQLAVLPTASISDALDFLGLPGSLHGMGPLRDGAAAVGQAFTVQYEPHSATRPGTVGDFLDDVDPGAVVVIDNAGRTDCTVWGGIMTRTATARGIAGTVIWGTCRDVPSILEVGYPMWSAARFMRTGKDRVQLRAVQVPLLIDGVTIAPGDWVCADDDGAVVVPVDCVNAVIAVAERIERAEAAITTAVLAGSMLREARTAHGYHVLQTPETLTASGTSTTPETGPETAPETVVKTARGDSPTDPTDPDAGMPADTPAGRDADEPSSGSDQ